MGFSNRPRIENFKKKTAEIFKKLENTIIASFPAKIGWERSRKRENKKKSFRFAPTHPRIENFKQIAEKIQKIREHRHSFFSAQNTMGNAVKERK